MKPKRLSCELLPMALLFLASSSGIAQVKPPEADLIHVEITGMRNDKGRVQCSLFSSAADFPKKAEKAVAHAASDISHGQAICEFAGISPGTYAVSVFHDENLNGKLDKNFVGAPKEGYGASNNPRKRMGPPPFSEASFAVNQPEKSVEIKLMY